MAGGDISAAWQIKAADHSVFLKTDPLTAYDMFLAEADGLREQQAPMHSGFPKFSAVWPLQMNAC